MSSSLKAINCKSLFQKSFYVFLKFLGLSIILAIMLSVVLNLLVGPRGRIAHLVDVKLLESEIFYEILGCGDQFDVIYCIMDTREKVRILPGKSEYHIEKSTVTIDNNEFELILIHKGSELIRWKKYLCLIFPMLFERITCKVIINEMIKEELSKNSMQVITCWDGKVQEIYPLNS